MAGDSITWRGTKYASTHPAVRNAAALKLGVSHTIKDPFYVGNMGMAAVRFMVKLLSLRCHFNCAPRAKIMIGQGLITALAPLGFAPLDIVYCLFEVKR